MERKITGMARAAEGLCSENLNLTLAIQNLSNMVEVQNRNGTAYMDNLEYNIDVHSLASSTSPRGNARQVVYYSLYFMYYSPTGQQLLQFACIGKLTP